MAVELPGGKKTLKTPRQRKANSAPIPIEPPITVTPAPPPSAPLEPPTPHAIPGLAAARDPNAPHVLHHDVETRSVLDLTVVGAHRYAVDPSTQVLCIAYAVDDEPVQLWTPGDPAVPGEFVEAASNPSWTVVAHNDQFERLISQHILQLCHGFPAIAFERRRCSQAMALAAGLPAALEKVIPALGLPFEKDKAGKATMLLLTKPLDGGGWIEDPALLEALYRYCKRDVEAERAVSKALPPLTEDEQRLWELDAVINGRGFHTDGPLLEAAAGVVARATAARQAEFEGITGIDSIHKRDKLIVWLEAHDCSIKDVKKATLKACLRRKELTSEARRAVELRLELAHAAAGKVEALRAWQGSDGRVRGTLRYHGAGTGRWTGLGVQPQNFKRDGKDIEAKIAAILAGGAGLKSPVEAVGDIARAMVCAAPGHRFMIADFSGIESRGLAWISGQRSKIDAWRRFDETGDPADDPYVQIAARCGITGGGARDAGKIIDLAFGFGGSTGAWKNAAGEDDETDNDTIKRYRETWKAAHKNTVRFWYGLEQRAIAAVRNPGMVCAIGRVSYRFAEAFLRLTLPSGRAISYPFPQIVASKFDRAQLTFLDNRDGKFEPCRYGQGAWFGMLVENVVQGLARDLLAAAMMRLEAAGYPVVLHVHDEVVVEVPDGFGTLEEFKRILVEVPAWAEGLPVAAKARNGPRFAKEDAPAAVSSSSTKPISATSEVAVAVNLCSSSTEPACAAPAAQDTAPEVHGDQGDGDGGGNGDGGGEDPLQALLADAADTAAPTYGAGEQRDRGTFRTEYIYKLENGRPHLKVTRRENPKSFPQSWRVNGAWVNRKPTGWVNVPYLLPELLAAPVDQPVWITEGEKDCETLAGLGLVATTAPEGAGKWRADYNKWFAGRKSVLICEDNDAAGRAHANTVAGALRSVGVADIRVVRFLELAEGGDVSDWLATGHTREDLIARAKTAPQWKPPSLRSNRASHYNMQAVEWVWQYRIAKGALNLLAGLPDKGKGLAWSDIVAHVTKGSEWPAKEGPAPCGNAIVFTAEDDITRTVVPRLVAASADLERVEIVEMAHNADGSERMFNLVTDLPALKAKIDEVGDVVLVIIDPVSAYLGVGKISGGSSTDVRGVLSPLTKLAEDKQAAILAVMHFNKKADITNAVLRIADSLAYAAAARSIYITVEDPENEGAFLFIKAKGNLAPTSVPALRYTIRARQVGFDEKLDKQIEAPFLVWGEQGVNITALEAMEAAAGGTRGKAGDAALEFLQTTLARGPAKVKEIFAEAKALGIAVITLRRAKDKLKIIVEKEQGTIAGEWFWRLPAAPTEEKAA
jgi:DNA polymerase